MRLIWKDAGKLRLTRDLPSEALPEYAILSHTWSKDDEDEVKYPELESPRAQNKPGYAKINFCRNRTELDGLEYFWVDTCCINKDSQSELQEAISSMYRWYSNAYKCYVYLSDVSCPRDSNRDWNLSFRTSSWFTRGWTLQELLAPKVVEFFSREGILLGTKLTLIRQIHEITKIPIDALRGCPLSRFSVPDRLKWIVGRSTRKKEDIAYCQQGLFGVFMTLRYAEGETEALARLKRKVSKKTHEDIMGHLLNVNPLGPDYAGNSSFTSMIASLDLKGDRKNDDNHTLTNDIQVPELHPINNANKTIFASGSQALSFTSVTDPTLQRFVKLPQHDLAARIEFLSNHRRLVNDDRNMEKYSDLLNQAVDFMQMANACMLSLGLIALTAKQPSFNGTDLQTALAIKDSPQRDDLSGILRELNNIVASRVAVRDSQDVDVENFPSAQRNDLLSEVAVRRDAEVRRDQGGVWRTQSYARRPSLRQSIDEALSAPEPRAQYFLDDEQTTAGSETRRLDPPFALRPGSWFKPGRVFALVWSQPAGESRWSKRVDSTASSAYTVNQYGTKTFNHIRQLIVVRNGHGSCWCVPIETYGGQGLKKRGLMYSDIHSHAVVYDAELEPSYLPNEPVSNKGSIAIEIANGVTLAPEARVHLGKPHNVEWNVKVKFIGNVREIDLKRFVVYVQQQLLG